MECRSFKVGCVLVLMKYRGLSCSNLNIFISITIPIFSDKCTQMATNLV